MQYLKRIRSVLEKHKKIVAFLVCTLVIFLIGYFNHPSIDKFGCDSGYYYQLSQSFVVNGNFDFTNFIMSFRGYVFPFILFFYTSIGSILDLDHSISILIGNSLFVSFLFIFILPNFFAIKKLRFIKIILPILIFMIYWQDLVYYPLSDLYSFGLIMIAIYLLKKIKYDKSIKSLMQGIMLSTISGALLYAVYNIRTIYIFAIPILLLVHIVFYIKVNFKRLAIFIVALTLGISICGLPQILINEKHYNEKTITVVTNSLFNFQLYTGMYLQRYETYIGDPTDYPQANMGFLDGVGSQIIQKEKLDTNSSVSDFIKVAIKYPLDYVGIMTRHFINIFHLPYNHVYIKDLDDHKSLFTIINYSILFIAGVGLFTIFKKKRTIKFSQNMIYLFVVLIPCIAILPGAIEMRFFMPMYCLIYCFIAYEISFHEVISYIKSNKLKVFVCYIFILAVLTAVWGSTFNATQVVPQLLN